jgi:hypothetical protein
VLGAIPSAAKNDQKTFVMLLRAVLPLQIEQEKIMLTDAADKASKTRSTTSSTHN